jgi:transglutaminase-like putative cysteine protease
LHQKGSANTPKNPNRFSLYLKATFVVDSNSRIVQETANLLTEKRSSEKEKAKALFYFARDEIKYNPYLAFCSLEDYRASETLQRAEGFCIQKAVVLTALARAIGIPARLGFADIKNHRASKEFIDWLGTNISFHHGYSELYLNKKWVKATPAFNIELCKKFDLESVEFDGVRDAVFHERNKNGEVCIEYIKYHGTFADLPFEELTQVFAKKYPFTSKVRGELIRLQQQ